MINTLDLDLITENEVNVIITKIYYCPNNLSVEEFDTQKGYHLKLKCSRKCDLCRLVFDDDKRYAIDRRMPLKFRDFLFTSKVPLGELPITKDNLEKIKELTI